MLLEGMQRWWYFSEGAQLHKAEAFHSACRPFVNFCAAAMALMLVASCADPGRMIAGYISACVTFGGFLLARLWFDRMDDQKRARLHFGRVLNVVNLLNWLVLVPWVHYHPPELISADAAAHGTLICFLLPIYLRFSVIHTAHRHAFLVINVLGFIMLPTFSELGRPAEPLFLSVALMLGYISNLPSLPSTRTVTLDELSRRALTGGPHRFERTRDSNPRPRLSQPQPSMR